MYLMTFSKGGYGWTQVGMRQALSVHELYPLCPIEAMCICLESTSFVFFHRRTSVFGLRTISPNLLIQHLSKITKLNAHQISCYTVLHSSRYYTCTKSSDLKHVLSHGTVSLPISYANQWQHVGCTLRESTPLGSLSYFLPKYPGSMLWKGLFWFCLICSTYTIF